MTMKPQTSSTNDPRWWNDAHTSAWERVKEAMKRDWEQTKADTTKHHGHELNQSAADTIAQATGRQGMPAPNQPTPSSSREDWKNAEPAVRYGYSARTQYPEHGNWDDKVETKLRGEWQDLKTGRTWDEARDTIRRGWESVHRKT